LLFEQHSEEYQLMFPFQKRLPWALIGIVLVVLAGGFLPAPASPRALSAGPGLADFLKQGGIWRADFQGQPICMVRLNPLVKEVEGGLSLAPDFSTDDNGRCPRLTIRQPSR